MATKDEKTSLNSAVTTDLPEDPAETKAQAKAEAAAEEKVDDSPEGRANAAGIGLVKVDGIGLNYIGIAPARDKKAETPSGLPIRPENSTFTPLGNVAFSNSIKIKDPKSGEYYYPTDGVTSWDACELNGSYLIPRK